MAFCLMIAGKVLILTDRKVDSCGTIVKLCNEVWHIRALIRRIMEVAEPNSLHDMMST